MSTLDNEQILFERNMAMLFIQSIGKSADFQKWLEKELQKLIKKQSKLK